MKKHGPWTIKKTESRFKNGLIEVFEDEVIKPDKTEGSYATLRIKDGVAIIALDDEGDAYLVKEFRYAVGREDVEVVGGAIDEGEKPIEAARRELKEELGIEADEWTELGTVYHSTSIINSSSTLFLARQLKFTEKDEDSGEVIKTVKMPFDEAVKKALMGDLTHATSCVLVLRAENHLRRNQR
jgi:ADP-ribose pyrophosphatase